MNETNPIVGLRSFPLNRLHSYFLLESPFMQVADRVRRIPLAWRILLSSSAVMVVLIIAMLGYVNLQAERFVANMIAEDLLQGRNRIESTIHDQFAGLSLTARLVASFPALKAMLSETDLPTIRDFLLTYQQQNHAPDILIALDPNGRVLARTDSGQADPIADVGRKWRADGT